MLSDRGKLFNDPREVLEDELRAPGVYFSLLEELASGRRSPGELSAALARDSGTLGPYIRFWFRFVFGMQDDLGAGLRPSDYWDSAIAPDLADHAAPVFEELCREWVRGAHGTLAPKVGSWWGPARNDLRRSGDRTTEEVDVVGVARNQVTLVGERQWTNTPLAHRVLLDLDEYKLPALRQSRAKVATQPRILLFSRSGFERGLIEAAAGRDDVELVDAGEVVNSGA